MAQFLISTMDAVGHVTPMLPVAIKLVERGHQVWWHTTPDFAAKVTATGAHFVPMQHTPTFEALPVDQPEERGLAAANGALRRLFVDRMLGQLADYQAILREFPADVVLADMCSLGAVLLNEQGGPPFATLGINPLTLASPDTPPFNSGLSPATTPLGRLQNQFMHWLINRVLMRGVSVAFNAQRAQVGLPPLPRKKTIFDVLISPFLHLQPATAAFEYPRRSMPAQIHFVGPLLPTSPPDFRPPTWWDELTGERPVVHVTQGTVATEAHALVLPALQALANDGILVVATTPDPAALGTLPANARVERFIPHAELLPHVDVMVTNAGYNGVLTALAHGVPLVAAGRSEDKQEVSARIAWAGAGIDLKTDTPSAEQLALAVRQVLDDPSFRRNAKRVQADFAQHDGPTEAALLLEQLAQTKRPVT